MIVAGEASGDVQAGALTHLLYEKGIPVEIVGIGGEKFQAEGGTLLFDSSRWGAIGAFDAVFKIPSLYLCYRKTCQYLEQTPPDLLLLIDSPAINLPIARKAKELRIPTLYFFPPSQWSCSIKRARMVGERVTAVLAPFSHTAEIYERAGVHVFFSGHPLLDLVKPSLSKEEVCEKFNLDPKKLFIAILPGSRDQEIRYLLPALLKTAHQLSRDLPDAHFLLPIASRALEEKVREKVERADFPVTATSGHTWDLINMSDFVVATSGSVTLEAAILGKPMIIVYRVSWLTWFLLRPFVRIPYAGLPNLVMQRKIVPEFFQHEVNPFRLRREVLDLLSHNGRLSQIQKDLAQVRERLGEPGALERVASLALEVASGKDVL